MMRQQSKNSLTDVSTYQLIKKIPNILPDNKDDLYRLILNHGWIDQVMNALISHPLFKNDSVFEHSWSIACFSARRIMAKTLIINEKRLRRVMVQGSQILGEAVQCYFEHCEHVPDFSDMKNRECSFKFSKECLKKYEHKIKQMLCKIEAGSVLYKRLEFALKN